MKAYRVQPMIMVAFVLLGAASAYSQAAMTTVPLTLRVAQRTDGRAAVGEAWLDRAFETAHAAFLACGVSLVRREAAQIPARFAWIETPRERSELDAFVTRDAMHAFFVTSLSDRTGPDELPPMGVHWRGRGPMGFVIVAAYADVTTLAHELGHAFGLGHGRAPNDLMNQDRRAGAARFDARQCRTVSAAARRWVGTLRR